MKKALLILFALLFMGIAYGQTIYTVRNLKSDVDFYMDLNKDVTFLQVNGGVSDTVGIVDSTWVKTIGVDNVFDQLKTYGKMSFDSIKGAPHVTVTFEGKDFWDDASWTVILTKTWCGTSADTVLLFDGSTAKHYRFYRYNVDFAVAAGGQGKVTELAHKFYK